jgi:hypothetical protein
LETSRAQELSRAAGTGKPTGGSGASGEDQVQISSLSAALAAEGSQRAAHVQNLAAIFQAGKYQPDPVNVSHALVNHALQAGTAEGGE